MKTLLLVLLALLMASLTHLESNEFGQLSNALQNIATTKETVDDSEKEPATFLWALEQKNKDGNAIFIYKNVGTHTYQIKVLEQAGHSCGLHGTRNAIYIIKMLTSKTKKEFWGWYEKMLDPNILTEDAKKLGINPNEEVYLCPKDIAKTLDPALPLFKWLYFNEEYVQEASYLNQKKARENIENLMNDLGDTDNDNAQFVTTQATCASTFAFNYYDEEGQNIADLYNYTKKLQEKENYTFGISLGWWFKVSNEESGHNSTLVVHKEKGETYFITADSMNNQIQGGDSKKNFNAALTLIQKLIGSINELKDAATRFFVYELNNLLQDVNNNQDLSIIKNKFAALYEKVFKTFEITTNPLFTKPLPNDQTYKETALMASRQLESKNLKNVILNQQIKWLTKILKKKV